MVEARDWRACKEGKQAEFLVEGRFLWELVTRIGVLSQAVRAQVAIALNSAAHAPRVEVEPSWYYRDEGKAR